MTPEETWGARPERRRRSTRHAPMLVNGRPADLQPLSAIDLKAWAREAVPERRWIVPGMIPERNVTLLGGDGGMGKSLLALQLAVACALGGRPWIGQPTRACRVLGYLCEDDRDELHRRLAPVLRHYGAGFSDIAGELTLVSAVGSDNLLLAFPSPYEAGEPTPLYHRIRETALSAGARLVLLDSLHDLFGGNENDRRHARQFVSELRQIALAIDGAVVLTAHPSKDGRLTGSGEAGSTAWNNAVRSRLYLTARRSEEAEAGAEADTRELKTMKANYAAAGGMTRLRWQDGVFMAETGRRARGILDRIELDNRVLAEMRAMIEQGAELAYNFQSPRAFVNAIRKRADFRAYNQATMLAAQARLIESGRARVVTIGPPSRARACIRPIDTTYHGEKGSAA
jgi:RecA-family ATPase